VNVFYCTCNIMNDRPNFMLRKSKNVFGFGQHLTTDKTKTIFKNLSFRTIFYIRSFQHKLYTFCTTIHLRLLNKHSDIKITVVALVCKWLVVTQFHALLLTEIIFCSFYQRNPNEQQQIKTQKSELLRKV